MAKVRAISYDYTPTKEDLKAMRICNDNQCYIYPLPLDNAGTRYKLQVYRPHKEKASNRLKTDEANIYGGNKSDWYKKIFELYNHLKKDYE